MKLKLISAVATSPVTPVFHCSLKSISKWIWPGRLLGRWQMPGVKKASCDHSLAELIRRPTS